MPAQGRDLERRVRGLEKRVQGLDWVLAPERALVMGWGSQLVSPVAGRPLVLMVVCLAWVPGLSLVRLAVRRARGLCLVQLEARLECWVQGWDLQVRLAPGYLGQGWPQAPVGSQALGEASGKVARWGMARCPRIDVVGAEEEAHRNGCPGGRALGPGGLEGWGGRTARRTG
jgi:hypothetical protein